MSTRGMKVSIPGARAVTAWLCHSVNTDCGSYQMHIQQKNPSEHLSYYAVFKVLQEMTVNAHLFDVYDDIYYHAHKFC